MELILPGPELLKCGIPIDLYSHLGTGFAVFPGAELMVAVTMKVPWDLHTAPSAGTTISNSDRLQLIAKL